MRGRKASMVAAVCLFASLLLGASFAWACTTQPYIQISPKSGEAGTVVDINGNSFGAGRVEIRWGSLNGEKLAETTGPSFSVKVNVPNVSPGVYYVLAAGQTLTGEQSSTVARDSFEVTPTTARSQPPAETSSGANNTAGQRTSSAPPQATRGGEAPPQTETQAPAAAQRPSLGSVTTDTGSGGRPADRNAPAGSAGGGPGGPAPAAGAPGGPPQGPGDTQVGQIFDPSPVVGPRSLARTVSPDLWSGFERATRSPGLLEVAEKPQSRRRDLALGVSLLGAGLISLLGSLLVLEAHRRRRTASTRR